MGFKNMTRNKIISIFASCFVVFVFSTYAQTRNIVPRGSGEGSIGTSEKPWGAGYFSNSLTLGQKTITEFNEASTRLVSTNVNQFSLGETTEINGIIGSIYDDTIQQEKIIYFGNEDFIIRESEDWKGNASTLVVSSDGLTGTLDGALNEKCISDGVWLYLSNSTTNVAIWATNVNVEKTEVQWNPEKQELDADSSWTVEKVSPLKQVKHIGLLYGYPSGISAATSTNSAWNPLNSGTTKAWYGVATADGVTVYAAVNNGVIWKSTDGGTTWTELTSGIKAWYGVATADGVTVYAAVDKGVIWKSTDGGTTWTELNSGATSWHNVATADGVTVYAAAYGGEAIWKSTDGGATWTALTSVTTHLHCVATADGVTVYAAADSGVIWKSTDGGATWTALTSGVMSWYGVATADGVTVYAAVLNGVIYKSIESGYSQSLNTFYTAIFDIKTNNLTKLNDIAFSHNGNNLYASFETNPDEWSVFGSDSSWHIITEKDDNEIWNVRTTDTSVYPYQDNMVPTTASSASEAISIALETNSLNRTDLFTYTTQPYGYANLTNNNLAIALTYYVPTANSTNTPALVATAMDYYGVGEMQENMKDYEVVLDATENKTTVTRTGEVDSNTMIYYIRNKNDDYEEE